MYISVVCVPSLCYKDLYIHTLRTTFIQFNNLTLCDSIYTFLKYSLRKYWLGGTQLLEKSKALKMFIYLKFLKRSSINKKHMYLEIKYALLMKENEIKF